MGRIFSYQDTAEERVPNPEVFDWARDAFTSLAETYIDIGRIDGSFIYGSVALGAANPRSDFDSFISLREGLPRNYNAVKTIVRIVEDETDHTVPILPIVQTRNALELGYHDMDRFFGQHLTSDYRIVQGGDPARYIVFPERPAGEVLGGYLFNKKRRLANTYTTAEPLDVEEGGIQRMLELPPAIGRKMLQALAEIGYIPEAVEKSADKSAVITKSRCVLDKHGVVEEFDRIVAMNEEYDDLLKEALNGRVDKKTYENVIEGLHAKLPRAIAWIDQVGEKLLPLFT